MNPNATALWTRPAWLLAVLLAFLGTLGPFSIDTYLPAFEGIAQALDASPVQMQQTLSAYLIGFAVANLLHGALSDSFGRRPVVLWGVFVFTMASAACAMSTSIGALIFWRAVQGMSAGAGIVVSRAVIRDMFPPSQAQKVMSQVTLFFGVAPAIAPLIGGWIFVHFDWHVIFWFLTLVGAVLWLVNWRVLPETLDPALRQSLHWRSLFGSYWKVGSNPRFLLLCFASGVPFNGVFLYILSAPAFLGGVLRLAPQDYFWFFCVSIGGIMVGAWLSGRLAGKFEPKRQIRWGFVIMLLVSIANVILNSLFEAHPLWSMWPIGLYALGWALMVPVVTLMVLDLVPERRGMASSVQAFIGSLANGLVAGVLAPIVMHSALGLALASILLLLLGLGAWLCVKPIMPTEALRGVMANESQHL